MDRGCTHLGRRQLESFAACFDTWQCRDLCERHAAGRAHADAGWSRGYGERRYREARRGRGDPDGCGCCRFGVSGGYYGVRDLIRPAGALVPTQGPGKG